MTFVIILIIISFVMAFLYNKNPVKEQAEKQNNLNQLINNNVLVNSKSYVNEEFSKAIILDETNKKVHLFSILENKCNTYGYEDVIKVEVLVDNSTITTTNRGDKVLGTVVGGVIAGIPGMIIGGLSSKKTTTEKIRNIVLKLTLNDMDNVIYRINFLNHSNKGFAKDSSEVKNSLTEIDKWNGYFSIILKQYNNVF